MAHRTLTVALGERSYPIHVGAGVLADPQLLLPHLAGRQVLLVSNTTVAGLVLPQVAALLAQADLDVAQCILPDGEEHKTLATWQHVLEALLAQGYGRNATVIAVGGGVVGDIAGFAAACFQRGCAFVQVPTTLLAQVDSSVGGKTAVNHPLGKNLIGAFHQPRCVLADTAVLASLPARELAAGLAEVVKYGLIREADFFCWLEQALPDLLAGEAGALASAVERSCAIKADVVAADEREGGVRAILNFGHTFGHAIEHLLGYGRWLHGEAVAAGMVLAADLSCRLGWLEPAVLERLQVWLTAAGLPVRRPAELDGARMLQAMGRDKKVLDGQLRLVLLRGLGEATVTADVATARIVETLTEHRWLEPA